MSLAPSKATDIVTMRGVLEQQSSDEDTTALAAVLLAEFDTVLRDFNAMRAAKGPRLPKS